MAQSAKFNMEIAANVKGANNIKRLGNSMQGVQGKVKNLSMSMGVLNNAFRVFAGIIAASAFTRFIKGAIDSADAFGKMSDQTGIAADKLQAYVNAGKLAGVEQGTIDKGLRRLAQSMREADQGIATYSDSYKALGISVRDVDGNLKKSETVLGEIADRFADMPDGATKAALAMEIFGRSGASLINLLNGGKTALEEFNYETSENFAENAEFFNDQIAVLTIRFDGFRKQLADQLLPTLNNLLMMFSNIFSSEQDFTTFFTTIEVGLKVISTAVFGTVAGFRFLITTIKQVATGVGELAQGNFSAAVEALGEGLTETSEQFKKDMEVFTKIWTGKENAPESYFANGNKAAQSLKMTVVGIKEEMEKTFGENMNAKLASFGKTMNDFGSLVGDTIVKAFKSLEDTLVNFVTTGKLQFKSLVQSIIADLARLTIRKGITQPLFNAFTSALGGGFNGGNALSGASLPSNVGGLSFSDAISLPSPYATGGFVNKPTNALIGEAGSEYVIRADQMDQAMRRYAKGARGQSVIDGVGSSEGESGHLVGAGAIDVRFDVQRINAVDYVTAQQFEQGIRSATEQGARKGEQMTLRRLQTSPNTRRRIGV